MSAEPIYIPTASGPLFAVLEAPAALTAPRAAVLLVPPALDEKRAAYAALARLARELASAGCMVLRFDYAGTGDSCGESAEVSISSMERDTLAAAEFLRARAGDDVGLALVGFRLGAGFALRLGRRLAAAKVAAVAPVASGATWLRQERGRSALRRSMIARELAAAAVKAGNAPTGGAAASAPAGLPPGVAEDLGGLPLGARFVEELGAFDLLSGAAESGGPETLVVQVSPRKTPLPETDKLAARHGARVECLAVEPFWQPLENPDVAPLAATLKAFIAGASQ